MSKHIITSNKIIKTREIVTKSDSSNNWRIESNNSNKSTRITNSKPQLKCTCKNIKYKKLNLNKESNITNSFSEKQIMSLTSENLNTLNSTKSNISLLVQTTESESNEKMEISKEIIEELRIKWDYELFIQVIERIQYLAAEPPKLFVQFPDDMLIHRAVNNTKIRLLIPLPDNYVQQQDHFEVLSKPVAKFGYLGKEQFEITFDNKKQLEQENHEFDIHPTKRMWKGPILPVKTNKLGIEEKNWNDLTKVDSVNSFEFIKEKKEESVKEIISESYSEKSIIFNDDYNKIKNLKMRPIIVSMLKINDDEETSTESLDIMQEIVIKNININIQEENNLIKSRFEFLEKNKKGRKYQICFSSKNKRFNGTN